MYTIVYILCIYNVYIYIYNIDLNAPEARSKVVQYSKDRQVFLNDFIGGTSISLHFGHKGLPGSENTQNHGSQARKLCFIHVH